MLKVWCHGHVGYDIYKDDILCPSQEEAKALIQENPTSSRLHIGGKGLNFAYALVRAGVSALLSGFIGNDALGARLEEECAKYGIATKLYRASSKTFACWIDENDLKVLQDGNVTKTEVSAPSFYAPNAVVLHAISDERFLPSLVQAAKENGNLLVFNPAPIENLKSLAPIHQADLLIANEHEAKAIAKMTGTSICGPLQLAGQLQKELKKNVVVTLGSRGVSAAFGDRHFYEASFPSKVIDAVGAGDAFLGFFLASYLRGQSISQSLQYGAAAGALACEVRGAIRPDLSVHIVEQHIAQNLCQKPRNQMRNGGKYPAVLHFGS